MEINRILEQQNLAGVNLNSCSLGGLDLRGKNLRGADLSHAHLGNANLSGADLRNANLSHANLGAANLTGADLRYSDLRHANLAAAVLDGADLREVIGLDMSADLPMASFVKPVNLEITEDFQKAQEEGYFPISHWGKIYALNDGQTLYKDSGAWKAFKSRFGDSIFGDRRIFSEVRLVKQYKNYSQWAYMVSKKGFERIALGLGLQVTSKG